MSSSNKQICRVSFISEILFDNHWLGMATIGHARWPRPLGLGGLGEVGACAPLGTGAQASSNHHLRRGKTGSHFVMP